MVAEQHKTLSERAFGLVVGAVFVFWACIPLARQHAPRPWLLLPAALMVLLALLAPRALFWPKKIWLGITTPLGAAVQFLLMAILFAFVITPVGLVFRLIGRDALKRRPNRQITSYWTKRTALSDMKQQF